MGINVEAWQEKGDELFRIAEYETAIIYYENILQLDPNNEVVWMNMGNALYNLKRGLPSFILHQELLVL